MCVRLGCKPGQAAVSYWEPKWLEVSDFLNHLLNILYSHFLNVGERQMTT